MIVASVSVWRFDTPLSRIFCLIPTREGALSLRCHTCIEHILVREAKDTDDDIRLAFVIEISDEKVVIHIVVVESQRVNNTVNVVMLVPIAIDTPLNCVLVVIRFCSAAFTAVFDIEILWVV